MNSNNIITALVELEEMEFYAFHGCFKEEQLVGNKFRVNIAFNTDCTTAATSDNIDDTVNYVKIYDITKLQMTQPSHLLENVASRILSAIKMEFPQIENLSVKVSKVNPPVGGQMKQVSVTIKG